MKRKLIWCILGIAFLFRFVAISQFPAGFNADEASFGYDAYSILRTGRDQWGNFLPILLKSFGDYKSPLYSYLAVPSVAVFGLSVFATRLPSVLIGTLATMAIYLLVNEITKHLTWLNKKPVEWLGHIAAFLLAVNPWSIMLSHGAAEANLISFFLPIGIFFYLKGLKENKFFVLSALFLGLNLFTYHSAKLITPLVVTGLLVVFWKQILKTDFKRLVVPGVVFLFFFATMLYTFKIGGGTRISERSIAQGALLQGFDERMAAISQGKNPKVEKILHNKYQVIVNRFVTNYFQYFSPKFLIENGPNDASYVMVPKIGVVYFLELVFLLGIIPLYWIESKSKKFILTLLFWLAITPLPAALASGGGYAGNRASGMLPVLQIVETLGLLGWVLFLKKYNLSIKLVGIVLGSIFIFEVCGFMSSYYKTQSTSVLKQQGYGNLQVFKWLKDNSEGRDVLVSRSISEPQIFVAFANKWNPNDFQKTTKTWEFDSANTAWVDQLPLYSLGNYTFKSIDWKTDINSNALIVVREDEFKGSQIPTKVLSFPDGTPNIYVVDTSQKIYAKAN